MRYCAYALAAVMMLAGCRTSPELKEAKQEAQARQVQAERILTRTITEKGDTELVEIEKFRKLPARLTKECLITYQKDRSVGEYVRVANENTVHLEDCRKRMNEILMLQPD